MPLGSAPHRSYRSRNQPETGSRERLELPAGFEKYLQIETIHAKIKALGLVSVEAVDETDNREKATQRVTLDVGRADGVIPKMKFRIAKPKGVSAWVVVLKVDERESEAAVTFWRDKGSERTPVTTAWRLATPTWYVR